MYLYLYLYLNARFSSFFLCFCNCICGLTNYCVEYLYLYLYLIGRFDIFDQIQQIQKYFFSFSSLEGGFCVFICVVVFTKQFMACL